MYNLTQKSQRELVSNWGELINSGSPIENDHMKAVLAQLFENTARDFAMHGLLTEAGDIAAEKGVGRNNIMGKPGVSRAGSEGVLKGKYGPTNVAGDPGIGDGGDVYLPNVVMPMLRRIFPDLIANELCGVQPLNGPMGFAFAYRAQYNMKGGIKDDHFPISNEIGYHPTDTRYTGDDGEAVEDYEDAWATYAGDNAKRWNGDAVDTEVAEFATIGGTMPEVSFGLTKTAVIAKTRKLAAHWSPELSEDMQAMHGMDVEAEMTNILSFEIGAEIDRQIVSEMVKAAITGKNVTTWNPEQADGLDQMGRLATLLTQITVEAQNVGLRTRRGPANFAIATPKVCALLQQMSMNKYVSFTGAKGVPSVPQSGVGALQKQGLINDGSQLLIRDAYATSGKDYVLLGYKGTHPGDSGIIYCPYIPVQLSKILLPYTMTNAIGARTRYGIMDSPWDSGRYYTFMKIEGLHGTQGYGWNDPRKFIAEPTTVDFNPPAGNI